MEDAASQPAPRPADRATALRLAREAAAAIQALRPFDGSSVFPVLAASFSAEVVDLLARWIDDDERAATLERHELPPDAPRSGVVRSPSVGRGRDR